MRRPVPHPLSVTLTTLRRARGLTVEELAELSGVSKGLITRYEIGRNVPSREKVAEFGAAMGYEAEEVDAVFLGVTLAMEQPQAGPLSPVDPSPPERRRMRQTAGRLAQGELAVIDEHLLKLVRASRAHRDRARPGDLVRWLLEQAHPQKRRDLVESSRQYHLWAVAERLCHESERAAAGSA